ncbi:hypothetical protein N5079_16940 [Planotetraspora sp. A-T 1434]|uniref:hypothetical protein n=1 Tax=Planotetraspora sp. A-T 1434 TaxID=2979219 RepID=UPI0021C06F40|nr:hypothetical protein [Planotetraspora sp. A-T 1434]MCT9931896.1 hypothetical protein [Planotetraspora sp. A-T 1434]
MYNTPVGGVAAGFGGTAAVASPLFGMNGIWLALALFAVGSAVLAVVRILPKRGC